MKVLKILPLLLVVSVLLVACGGAKNMELNPASATLNHKGATLTLTAAFKDSGGKAAESKKPLVWSSSNAGVASVNNGVVTAASSGTAVITATTGELTASSTITVHIPEPTPTPVAPIIKGIEKKDSDIKKPMGVEKKNPAKKAPKPKGAGNK